MSDEPAPPPEDVTQAIDETSIPTDPAERLARVPIPNNAAGRPVILREGLRAEVRAAARLAHDEKVHNTLKARRAILERCATDVSYREKIMEACRRDCAFFINHFAFSYDDREAEPVTPLVLYPAQEAAVVDWVRNYVNVLEDRVTFFDEKSRAWGWTWVFATWARIWTFLFKENWTTLYGHDKIEKLDDGGLAATHQTTFGKIRYGFKSLPAWMVPDGLWNERTNKICTIQHPKNHNLLKGDFYSANFGRGDRFSDICNDEVAASEKFGAAETSFKQTSRRAHMGTTPRGKDNDAGRLRWGTKRKTIRTFHWSDNPRLNVDWYWEQRRDYTPEQAASELDISWELSVGGRVHKSFQRSRNVADFEYEPNLPLVVVADPGFDDPTAMVWFQPNPGGREWRIVDFVQCGGRPGEFYVPFLTGAVPELTLHQKPWPYRYDPDLLAVIKRHGEWKPLTAAFGGSDGAASNIISGSVSLYDMWQAYGCPFVYPVTFAGARGVKEEAIRIVEIAIPRIRIARRLETERPGGPMAPTIVECFEQYSWVDRTANKTGRKIKREPKHDIYCHAMDAVQMFLWGEDVVSDATVMPVPRIGSTPLGATLPDALPPGGGAVMVIGQDIDPVARGSA